MVLSHAAEPTKALIAHGAISNNVEPLWIAKEQGIFRKYGIEAELVFIIAGRAMQAMLAGQVPVGLVGGNACRQRQHRRRRFRHGPRLGKPARLFVSRQAERSRAAKILKVKKSRSARRPVRLRWRPMWPSIILALVPRRDNIVLLGIGGVPERMGALRSGSVDATSLSPEFGQVGGQRRLSRVGRPG